MQMTHDLFIGLINGQFRWFPFFKLTNLCNYRCAHCCERSGPDAPRSFIAPSTIKAIIDSFTQTRNYAPLAALSGGEPMMAYTTKSVNYIPKVMDICAKMGFCIELKTNAGWTLGDMAPVIFRDLENIFIKNRKLYFAYHLSLDKFHPKSAETTIQFLRWYATSEHLSVNAIVHLFYDDTTLLTNTLTRLYAEYGLKIDFCAPQTCPIPGVKAWPLAGKEKWIVPQPYQGIDNAGRAMDNHLGTRSDKTMHDLISRPTTSTAALFFDPQGMASPIGCDWDDIRVPYMAPTHQIKPVAQVKRELFEKMWEKYKAEERIISR